MPTSRPTKEQYVRWKRTAKGKLRAVVIAAKDRPCADCGGSWPPYVMDFDHGTNEKCFSIAQAVARASIGMDRLLDEIAKCEVVCANCHRLRHAPVVE